MKDRVIAGNWMGTLYGANGQRYDWALALNTDGSYRSVDDGGAQQGRWTHSVNTDAPDTLDLRQDNAAPGSETERYWIHDIIGWERVNTLLILRRVAVASRNLPVVLYRVHGDIQGA
jgi:hypothetical protein